MTCCRTRIGEDTSVDRAAPSSRIDEGIQDVEEIVRTFPLREQTGIGSLDADELRIRRMQLIRPVELLYQAVVRRRQDDEGWNA